MARWTDSNTPISKLSIEDTECYTSTLSHTRFLPLRLERGQMDERNGIPPPSMGRGSHAADFGSGTTTFPPKVRSWGPKFEQRICKNVSTEDITSFHETCRACNKGKLQATSSGLHTEQNAARGFSLRSIVAEIFSPEDEHFGQRTARKLHFDHFSNILIRKPVTCMFG